MAVEFQHSAGINEQQINQEKVETENLKFRTDLLDQDMDGWSETQLTLQSHEKFHSFILMTNLIDSECLLECGAEF